MHIPSSSIYLYDIFQASFSQACIEEQWDLFVVNSNMFSLLEVQYESDCRRRLLVYGFWEEVTECSVFVVFRCCMIALKEVVKM